MTARICSRVSSKRGGPCLPQRLGGAPSTRVVTSNYQAEGTVKPLSTTTTPHIPFVWSSTNPTIASVLRGVEQARRNEGRVLTDEDLDDA